jgi:hypothetical protein
MSKELDADTFCLLGIAIYLTQKFEFGLYGIAAHLTHLPEVKKNRNFSALTPQDFLSTDPDKKKLRKATLGQLASAFGEKLALPASDLEAYVKRRNIIAHEFWRETSTNKGTGIISDPHTFLLEFIKETELWVSAIQGLLSHFIEAAARKEGREREITITAKDIDNRKKYESLVIKVMSKQNGAT